MKEVLQVYMQDYYVRERIVNSEPDLVSKKKNSEKGTLLTAAYTITLKVVVRISLLIDIMKKCMDKKTF